MEPPLIPTSIPILGHFIGMIRKGSGYYKEIAAQYPDYLIYSLDVPRGKIYVVKDPTLVQEVDSRPKTFSFNPIVLHFATRFLVVCQQSVQKLADFGSNEERRGGRKGLTPVTLKLQHDALAPGRDLDAVTQTVLAGILEFLDPSKIVEDQTVGLAGFFKKFVTMVSTDAIYGVARNPYKNQRVMTALWQVFKDFERLGLNIFPKILAPKGNAARLVIFNAMKKYYASDGHTTASRIIQDRFATNKQHEIPQQDIEHFDLALSFGLLANAPAAMFWVIFYVYSNHSLLSEIRKTVEGVVDASEGLKTARIKRDDTTEAFITVNIAEVADSCPLLTSLVYETLRVESTSASARIVTQDTVLGGHYLLKKGSFIMSPSAVIHKDERAWGPTATKFDAFRFMPQGNNGPTGNRGAEHPRISKSANRSWGGGLNMCPGRYFAMRELLSILVITVLRYDIHPVLGHWVIPKTKGHMVASIMEPVEDIEVCFRKRRDQNGVTWKFTWDATK